MSVPVNEDLALMDDNQMAEWILKEERKARGLEKFDGYESNVTGVAKAYADYLLENDKWGHNENGTTQDRLEANQKINNCHDDTPLWMENLAAYGTSGNSIPNPVIRAIYDWMYNDSSSSWLHRQMILYDGFNNNHVPGSGGEEGYFGYGRASGGPYTISGAKYNFAEVIVMNAFDQCENWNIDLKPSSIFKKLEPADGAKNQPTSVTIKWEDSSFATSYEYCIDETDDDLCSDWISNGASTSKTISGLKKGTTYSWHVRARNKEGQTYSNLLGDCKRGWHCFYRFTTEGSAPPPPTARTLYLPITLGKKSASPGKTLSGRVTDKGVPVQTTVELRYNNGSGESTYATADTSANGEYEFRNLPKLSGDQYYYVRKYNEFDINYWLTVWNCSRITASTTDSSRYRCDFDLQDIALGAPINGATVALPSTFSWTARTTTTDSYVVHFADISDNDPYASTNALGYVGSATITSVPTTFIPGVQYVWWVSAKGPNGEGISLYYNNITFTNTGNTPE
jgi:hypothetical protein